MSGSSKFMTSRTIPKSESLTSPSELQSILAGYDFYRLIEIGLQREKLKCLGDESRVDKSGQQ